MSWDLDPFAEQVIKGPGFMAQFPLQVEIAGGFPGKMRADNFQKTHFRAAGGQHPFDGHDPAAQHGDACRHTDPVVSGKLQ